jgi:hypothetical protein
VLLESIIDKKCSSPHININKKKTNLLAMGSHFLTHIIGALIVIPVLYYIGRYALLTRRKTMDSVRAHRERIKAGM